MSHKSSADKNIWLQVGELAAGFAPNSYILPKSIALVSKTYILNFMNAPAIKLTVTDEHQLSWAVAGKEIQTAPYRASCLREGIFFIDFIANWQERTSISIVLDTTISQVTILIGGLPDEKNAKKSAFNRVLDQEPLTSVSIDIQQGFIDHIPIINEVSKHVITDDLIGMRNQYTYSPTESYEHIYLNSQFYSWHCLKGVEQHLADTDRCHYYKIAANLYLFIWREKIIPTLGVIL